MYFLGRFFAIFRGSTRWTNELTSSRSSNSSSDAEARQQSSAKKPSTRPFDQDPTSSSCREYAVPVVTGRFEEGTRVLVWRMPYDLSQSRMAGRQERSRACVIICVRFVSIFYRNGITFPSIPTDVTSRTLKCPGRLVNALANAILDGNEISTKKAAGNIVSLGTALAYCENDLQRLCCPLVRGFLACSLAKFLDGACRSKPLAKFKQIFFVLAMFQRAVTIIYDRSSDTIGFMDPHAYYDSCGALIACAPFADLDNFVAWLASEIFYESLSIPFEHQYYRLAVLSFDGKLTAHDRPLDYPVPSISDRAQIFPARAPEEILEERRKDWSELKEMASRKVYEEQMSRLRKAVNERTAGQGEDPFSSPACVAVLRRLTSLGDQ